MSSSLANIDISIEVSQTASHHHRVFRAKISKEALGGGKKVGRREEESPFKPSTLNRQHRSRYINSTPVKEGANLRGGAKGLFFQCLLVHRRASQRKPRSASIFFHPNAGTAGSRYPEASPPIS
ncbi:hypothetical protein AVEN_243744-1 [Araneus ventricosus]|uniref:Uncharacterized protein n=1 Tax=Araneus ventricosus TaxID=182803 RepID=A0A4Y2A6B3_ARAVE|nr:hypothetical protein AVEN_243744-1 [Araneus ventricosus]